MSNDLQDYIDQFSMKAFAICTPPYTTYVTSNLLRIYFEVGTDIGKDDVR